MPLVAFAESRKVGRALWLDSVLQLESIFGPDAPGVLVVTDEPHAAYRLRDELVGQNVKRPASERWSAGNEYKLVGMPCAVKSDGLLPPGTQETRVPAPREIDTEIVDAEAAKVVSRLNRVANAAEGGREAARAVTEAMGYLNRIAALPCGVRDLSNWLVQAEAEERARQRWAWPSFYASLLAYSRTGQAGEQQKTLLASIEVANKMVTNYENGTPFAHLLARCVGVLFKEQASSCRDVLTLSQAPGPSLLGQIPGLSRRPNIR